MRANISSRFFCWLWHCHSNVIHNSFNVAERVPDKDFSWKYGRNTKQKMYSPLPLRLGSALVSDVHLLNRCSYLVRYKKMLVIIFTDATLTISMSERWLKGECDRQGVCRGQRLSGCRIQRKSKSFNCAIALLLMRKVLATISFWNMYCIFNIWAAIWYQRLLV